MSLDLIHKADGMINYNEQFWGEHSRNFTDVPLYIMSLYESYLNGGNNLKDVQSKLEKEIDLRDVLFCAFSYVHDYGFLTSCLNECISRTEDINYLIDADYIASIKMRGASESKELVADTVASGGGGIFSRIPLLKSSRQNDHNNFTPKMNVIMRHALTKQKTDVDIDNYIEGYLGESVTNESLDLIFKMLSQKTDGLPYENLSTLTVAHVDQLRVNLNVKDLDIRGSHCPGLAVIALIKKLNPTGELGLLECELSNLTPSDVSAIERAPVITDLDLVHTGCTSKVVIEFLKVFKPTGIVILFGCDLSELTEDDVSSIQKRDGSGLESLSLIDTNCPQEVTSILKEKLRPTTIYSFNSLDDY
jgi:hypothetical protein